MGDKGESGVGWETRGRVGVGWETGGELGRVGDRGRVG